MPILKPEGFKLSGLAIRTAPDGCGPDGYEQGGLVYFTMDGKEMVLIVRERKDFDRHAREGKTLRGYANSIVSDPACEAAQALVKLIPHAKRW